MINTLQFIENNDLRTFKITSDKENNLTVESGRLAIIECSNKNKVTKPFLIGVGEKFEIHKNKKYFINLLVSNTRISLSNHYNLTVEDDEDTQKLFADIDDYYFGYEERYKKIYSIGADLWETGKPNESLLMVFRRYPNLFKGKVIDLGCGEGRDTIFLHKQNIDVQGIDISHSAIEKAKVKIGNFNDEQSIFSTGNVLYLNKYEDETFDLAMNMGCLHMIHKNSDRLCHLKNVARVLKKGGYFLVDHCKSEWGNGFHTIEDYDQVKEQLKNFHKENYIDRIVRVNGEKIKIPLKVIPYLEKSKIDLIKEITYFGFEVVETFDTDTESFGNSTLALFRKIL
ncbi:MULTISPECIES: class I SAM-dependent methyltransferase [unclassified Staphylococcus]|uniref:class I SAM-dependent methyltransferase n=1 Tax=unclassified Staphylococcus TaxID=91994 RepID=UPI001AEC0550|nr:MULTISPECIES: class I SAM-dependent methyltransferase [unclassified Staphylococcus]